MSILASRGPSQSMVRGPEFDDAELTEISARFEGLPATAAIEWAVDQFHPFLCLSASMTDAVLIDVATSVEPSIEVVFIDTGYHFPQTLETAQGVRQRYGLNLRIMTVPPQPVALWRTDPAGCCSAAKVDQLDRALHGKLAWMSGLRRAEAPTRCQRPHRGPRPARPGQGQPHRHLVGW
ncbi:MAG: phosphoadenosine phosphosulfate reductase family protein [Actinomycetota bacterium]|nr:phosphoadenosine phosphosulfate reductase family protein [Actinomycetota bacterium]